MMVAVLVKIRSEMDIPAPGDIRNVIAALSDAEPVIEELFQYRFKENQIEGHSLGNLLLAALTNIKRMTSVMQLKN